MVEMKIEKGLRGIPTINNRRPARDDIPLLNVGLVAGIFSTSSYVMERIRGVVSSGCEFLKKVIYWIHVPVPNDKR